MRQTAVYLILNTVSSISIHLSLLLWLSYTSMAESLEPNNNQSCTATKPYRAVLTTRTRNLLRTSGPPWWPQACKRRESRLSAKTCGCYLQEVNHTEEDAKTYYGEPTELVPIGPITQESQTPASSWVHHKMQILSDSLQPVSGSQTFQLSILQRPSPSTS